MSRSDLIPLNRRETDEKTIAERRWKAPAIARKPQQACDIGLFSDEADQLDLCEMFQDPVDDQRLPLTLRSKSRAIGRKNAIPNSETNRLASRIRKWSDAKLDKEFAFAILASDADDPNNVAWVAAVKVEAARRRMIQPKG